MTYFNDIKVSKIRCHGHDNKHMIKVKEWETNKPPAWSVLRCATLCDIAHSLATSAISSEINQQCNIYVYLFVSRILYVFIL